MAQAMKAVLLMPELLERLFALLSRKDMKTAVLVCKWGKTVPWLSYDELFQAVVLGVKTSGINVFFLSAENGAGFKKRQISRMAVVW